MNNDFFTSGLDGYVPERLDESTLHYIDSYWLDRRRLEKEWADVIRTVFKYSEGKVSIVPGYQTETRLGGILFTKEEFQAFVANAKLTEARRFAVIEDVGQIPWQTLQKSSFLRFSYPIDIAWDELTSSSILAEDIFIRPIRCFFVITDNAKLAKYVNNDADPPYELISGAW